jgi:carbon-monoxide dehydrogenase medium subunit
MSLQAAAPRDLAALELLLREPGQPRFIAGGTDILAQPDALPCDGLLLDISGIAALRGIALADDRLCIGAGTTIVALAESPLIRSHIAALAVAASQCGSVQIRNRATIGGNVANAAPAADLPPVLKCAGAKFAVMGRDGAIRQLAFDALMPATGGTALEPGDLITEIVLPTDERLPRSGFVKLGRRQEMTIARLNLAMQASFDTARCAFGAVRLVAGAIGPAPLMLVNAAAALAGASLSRQTIAAFLDVLVDEVDDAIPGRASRLYKRRAIKGLGLDLLAQVTGCDAAELEFESGLP